MKCGICKGVMEEKSVTYTEDVNQGVVVIRYVPAHVCTECGNIWYTGSVAAQLEKLIATFLSLVGSEVSIIDFTKSVA